MDDILSVKELKNLETEEEMEDFKKTFKRAMGILGRFFAVIAIAVGAIFSCLKDMSKRY